MKKNIKITIQYIGTGYCGWQSQAHDKKKENAKTIQDTIEDAIYNLIGKRLRIQCAGRTDAGVHANEQVANFFVDHKHDIRKFIYGLNFYLKNSNISILNAEQVSMDFNARFSASQRQYIYYIYYSKIENILLKNRAWHVNQQFDLNVLNNQIKYFIGKHDFQAFTKDKEKLTIRTIDSAQASKSNIFNYEVIKIEFASKSFLHNQVRIMVGTLYDIARGKLDLSIEDIIISKDRTKGGVTAPPEGLFLNKIKYDN